MDTFACPKIRFQYLIPNSADEKFGCTVSTVGSQIIDPDDDYPSKDHPPGYMFDPARGRILQEYQLLYIVRGKGVFSNDDGSYEINKGTIILLRPGNWHTYKPLKGAGWSEYFIGFSGELAARSIAMLFPEDRQVFDAGLNRELVDLYQRAVEVAATDRPAAQQLLCGIVMHMLGIVNFTVRNEALSKDRLDLIIEQAKIIMQENVLRNLDLDALAAQLNISYSWFRKIFRDYYQMADMEVPPYFADEICDDFKESSRNRWAKLYLTQEEDFKYRQQDHSLLFDISKLNTFNGFTADSIEKYRNALPIELCVDGINGKRGKFVEIKADEFFKWIGERNPYAEDTAENEANNEETLTTNTAEKVTESPVKEQKKGFWARLFG